MENSKIAPYQASLERYVLNASEALTLNTYRRSIAHILKIGLMTINATTAVVCRFDSERYESTVMAETSTTRASHHEQTHSDIGQVYDEREYSTAFAWLIGENHEPLQMQRDKLEKDCAEYREFIEHGFFTAIYLPIKINSSLWGYVEVWESRYLRSFTDEEIEILQEVAYYVAKAVAANNPNELL